MTLNPHAPEEHWPRAAHIRHRFLTRLLYFWPLLLLGFNSAYAEPRVLEEHHYQEVSATARKTIFWRLQRDGDLILTSIMPDEISVCRMDERLETLSWQVVQQGAETDLTARRRRNRIVLSGKLGGTAVQRTLEIDGAPWYQAGSLSLRTLLHSDADEAGFWILRPGKFTAHKLIARKKGIETLPSDSGQVDAHVIEVSLKGFLAPFWSGTYWFRAEDGVLLRYRSPSGPPGSPETVIQWVPPSSG